MKTTATLNLQKRPTMTNCHFLILTVALLLLSAFCTAQAVSSINKNQISASSNVFIENKGQLADNEGKVLPDVLFQIQLPGMQAYFRNSGISFVLIQHDKSLKQELTNGISMLDVFDDVNSSSFRFDLNWQNSSKDLSIEAQQPTSEYFNYYYSHCPDGIHFVKGYEKLVYQNVYDGIDMVFYLKERNGTAQLEYDMVVHPGANLNQIKLKYDTDGLDLTTNLQTLQWQTPMGLFSETMGAVYQPGENEEIAANYTLENGIISFEVTNYDPAKDLIIDPFFTYYGGNGGDSGWGITTDGLNNILVTGSSNASGLPVTAGLQNHEGSLDAFIVKFDNTGNLIWATYYGGSKNDFSTTIATDSGNRVFFSGQTYSTDFPVTDGSLLLDNNDAYVASLNSMGVVIWSKYLGREENEGVLSIITDGNDNVIVCGNTRSTGFPVSGCLPPSTYSGGGPAVGDGFITRFDNSGNIQWSTYIGGSGRDMAIGVTVDNGNNVLVTGYTQSDDFQPALAGKPATTNEDIFLVKYDANCGFLWGTRFGGDNGPDEKGYSVAVDGVNNDIVVAGYTNANDFPSTASVVQPVMDANGFESTIVSKFNAAGVMQWSSYYGGEFAYDVAIDNTGSIWLTGKTIANDITTTTKAIQPNYGGGNLDAFIARLSSDGQNTLCATYYGGSNDEIGRSIAIDNSGNVLICGETYSPDLPFINTSSYQSNLNGIADAFIASICSNCNDSPSVNIIEASPISICSGEDVTLNANSLNPITWTIDIAGNYSDTTQNADSTQIVIRNITDTITVDACVGAGGPGCLVCETVTINVVTAPTLVATPADETICPYDAPHDFVVDLLGAAPWTLKVKQPDGSEVDVPCLGTPCDISANEAGCYTLLKVTDAACFTDYNEEFCLNFHDLPTASISIANGEDADICPGETVDLEVAFIGTADFGFTYQKDSDPPMPPIILPAGATSYSIGVGAGVYKITKVNDANCINDPITDVSVTITEHPLPILTITNAEHGNADNTIWKCEGDDAIIEFNYAGTAPFVVDSSSTNDAYTPGAFPGGNLIVRNPGNYKFPKVTDAYCEATTVEEINVANYTQPTVDITADKIQICTGEEATLTLNLGDNGPFNVNVKSNPVDVNFIPTYLSPILNGHQIIVTPAITTTYKTIDITDANNCTAIIEKEVTITVHTTDAGELDTNPIIVCETDNATVIETTPVTTDADDVVEYLLHDGTPYAGNIIHDRSAIGTFLKNTLVCGNTYYITRIAGNDDGTGQVDETDPCFKQTSTVPVTWRCTPDANFEDTDFDACVGSQISTNVLLTPNTLALDYNISAPGVNRVGVMNIDAQTFSMPANNVALNLINVQYNTGPACAQVINKVLNITALDSPSLVSKTETCNTNNDKYSLSIELANGDQDSYRYKVIAPVGHTGTFTGNTWNSDLMPLTNWIASGVSYHIQFYDDNNCDTLDVTGTKDCNCATDAGTMNDLTTQTLCEDQLTNPTHLNDWVNDLNDIFTFVLSDVAVPTSAANIVSWKNDGIIGFDSNTMTCGTTYYLMAVAGNDLNNGQVDFTDACFDLTQAIPVMWRCAPDYTRTNLTELCVNTDDTISFTLSGSNPPFNLSVDGNIIAPSIYSPYKMPVNIFANKQIVIDSVGYSTTPYCYVTKNDIINITALTSPSLVSKTATCNTNNDAYVVTITLTGGEPGSYQFDPITRIPAGLVWTFDGIDTWTSSPIPSGDNYKVDFFDGNNCAIEEVSGQKTCNCSSNAGAIAVNPIVICEDELTSIIVVDPWTNDANDVFEFVLHDITGFAAGAIARNKTGVFPIGNLNCGTKYYITGIAGNDDSNGNVDLNDACLSQTAGVEVVWRCTPNYTRDNITELCSGKADSITFNMTGSNPPFNLYVDNVEHGVISPYKLPVQAPQTDIVINKIGYSTIPFCYNTINDTITIKTLDSPSLVSKTATCSSTNDSIQLRITLSGGDSTSYAFSPISSGAFSPAGSTTWISNWLPTGAYAISFYDKYGCDSLDVAGNKTCPCTSNAGTVDTNPIDVCENLTASVVHNNDHFLDGDDMLEFILHNGNNVPLDRNTAGIFTYNVAYAYNTTYYITALVGDTLNNQVDLLDDCLSTSANVPVIFRPLPEMTLTALPNDSICLGDIVALEFTLTKGVAPFSVYGSQGALTGISSGHQELVFPTITTTYAFDRISDQHCSNTINEQVTIILPPPFDVTPSQTAVSCHDSFDGVLSVEVTGGYGNYSYQWYDDTPAPITGQTNNNITNLGPGDYSVIISDAIGCNYTEYFTLNKPPLFDIDLVAVLNEICFQDSAGQLRVESPDGVAYTIGDPVNLPWQNDSIFLNMHYLPGTNDYEIIATDANGCMADTIIDITGLTPITWVNAPEDRYLCPNTPTELEGEVTGGNSGAYTYFWDSIPGGSTHIVNPPATTTYEVYAKDARGCPSTNHFVTVSIPDPLTAQTTHPNSLCIGNEGMLSAFPLGGAGSYQYQWLNTVNQDTHSESIWSIIPDTTTSYQIKVTDSCGTEFVKAIQVIVPEPIDVTFVLSTKDGCVPLTATFTNTTTSGYKTRQWNFGNGSSTNNNPTNKWLRTGQYITSLTLIDEYDCEYKNTDTVNVHPNATALFSFFPDKINAALPEVQLRNHSQFADSYTWTIDSLGTSSEEEPIITFPEYESGSYRVCLLANNEYNCPDELCKYIRAENENMVFVPNFFTPNGDNLNEGFKPVLSSDKINHYAFMVFDRWGELLFSTSNQLHAWDGTYKNEPVKPDTYTWKLQVRFTGEATIRKHSGIITLGK